MKAQPRTSLPATDADTDSDTDADTDSDPNSIDHAGVESDPENTRHHRQLATGEDLLSVTLSGTMVPVHAATYASEAQLLITDAHGTTALAQPFQTGAYTDPLTVSNLVIDLSVSNLRSGPLSIEFIESYDDGPGVDQQWTDLT